MKGSKKRTGISQKTQDTIDTLLGKQFFVYNQEEDQYARFPVERTLGYIPEGWALTPEENALCNSILQTIPEDELREYLKAHESELPWPMDGKMKGILKSKEEWRERNTPKVHESNAQLIRLYADKKSGRVVYARKKLQERFEYMGDGDRKKTVGAFLEGSRTDNEWAMGKLLHEWYPCFRPQMEKRLKESPDTTCCRIIVKWFPSEFVMEHIDELSAKDGVRHVPYEDIYERLKDEPGFTPDTERIDNELGFLAKYRLGLIDEEQMMREFYKLMIFRIEKILNSLEEERSLDIMDLDDKEFDEFGDYIEGMTDSDKFKPYFHVDRNPYNLLPVWKVKEYGYSGASRVLLKYDELFRKAARETGLTDPEDYTQQEAFFTKLRKLLDSELAILDGDLPY